MIRFELLLSSREPPSQRDCQRGSTFCFEFKLARVNRTNHLSNLAFFVASIFA